MHIYVQYIYIIDNEWIIWNIFLKITAAYETTKLLMFPNRVLTQQHCHVGAASVFIKYLLAQIYKYHMSLNGFREAPRLCMTEGEKLLCDCTFRCSSPPSSTHPTLRPAALSRPSFLPFPQVFTVQLKAASLVQPLIASRDIWCDTDNKVCEEQEGADGWELRRESRKEKRRVGGGVMILETVPDFL